MAYAERPTPNQQQSVRVKRPGSGLCEGRIESLDDYMYSSLVGQDIRLLELLPGDGDEDVRIRIRHCPLIPRKERPKEDSRMSLKALRETLPQGWNVYKTVEGRYLFLQRSPNSKAHQWLTSTWLHPDESFNTAKYERVSDVGESEEDVQSTRFEALSYAWGRPRKKPVYVRVENGNQQFKLIVWPNLMSALRHLRPRDSSAPRTMWVDAICLNQKDHMEKSLHVPRMRDIYRIAHRTVVWLGPQCEATGLAFETVEHIASHVELAVDNLFSYTLPTPGSVEIWYDSKTELPWLPAKAWEALASLLSLSWFARLWVVQEVQLSKTTGPRGSTIHWGPQFIERSSLCKAVNVLQNKSSQGWPLPQIVSAGHKLEQLIFRAEVLLQPQIEDQLPSIRRLFREHAKRDCVDDRDRVFGLLGLTGARFSQEIKVCYDDSYGTADVNRDAVLTHTRLTGRLELLEPRGQSYRRFLVDVPSWVPEWSIIANIGWAIPPTFPANNTRAHIKHDKHRPDVLHVLGFQCAVIDQVTKPLEWAVGENPWKAIHHVRSWQPHDLGTAIYMPTGETMKDAYAVTLRMANLDLRWPYEDLPEMQKWVEQDYTGALFGSEPLAPDKDPGYPLTPQIAHPHILKALQYCTDRCFFQTKEGYMGIANRDTRKGDIVATFLGCVTPVVLRPAQDTCGQIKFLWGGECFVHGLHDSLKLLGPITPPWRGILEDFTVGRRHLRFRNTETGEETWQDPRLPQLEEWEGFWPEIMEPHYPMDSIFLRHRSTGEEITYDPRLEPDRLEARGVDLTWFTLV